MMDEHGSSVVVPIDEHEATQAIIKHAWDFLSNDGTTGPVKLLNELLRVWLSNNSPAKHDDLITDTHILLEFIVELGEHMQALDYIKQRQQAPR